MKKQTLLKEDGYTYIDVEFSHNTGEKRDVIINCPHGFHDDGSFHAFPDMKDILKKIPPEILEQYLLLEYDFGSELVAKAVFDQLKKTKNVALIHFYYDRGILDGNREENRAVRKIFNHKKYPETVQKLLQISRKTGENILDFCQKNLKPNGFFIDVHSMWPTSQLVHPSDFEHENRLQKYVHALLHPENQKEVRAINFLVHDQNGEPIADKKRSDMIAKHMIKNGFPVVFDAPYKLLPGYNSSKYYLHFSGLSIDIPRTFLGNPISESDIPKWAEDHEKIHKLSDCLSEGILLATEE